MNDEVGIHNPWGASPSYRDRLAALQADQTQHNHEQMQDIIDSPDRDTFANGDGSSRRDASSSTIIAEDTTMDADTYTARMKDILGSDGDGETSTTTHPEHEPSLNDIHPYSSPSTPPDRATPILSNDNNDDENSFQYPHPVPEDVSFSTNASPIPRLRRPSTGSSSRLFMPRSTSGTGLSSFRMSTSGASAASDTPQRPAAYPSLSRLRASIGRVAGSSSLAVPKYLQANASLGSPTSSTSRTKPRSALPFEFTAQGQSAIPDDDTSMMAPGLFSQHSRQSSFSSSLNGSVSGRSTRRRRERVNFPYGPVGNGVASLSSAHSLASDSVSVVPSVRPATYAEPSDLKETRENSRADLTRDFVKWSALRRIVTHVRSGPSPEKVKLTVLAVAGGLIAIGTQGGRVVVCDFAQDVVASCGYDGQDEGDSVTALAFSSDHTFLGVGHASGTVFLYDLKTPGRAARHIPPVPLSLVKTGRKEGHLSGSAIIHIGFIGLRHTAIVTADSKGLAFYHALGKILGVSSNDTLRLLGKYPEYEHEDELGLNEGKKRSTIYQMSPLPLGPRPHLADDAIFVAIITPTKLVLVGLKPTARTWFRKLNSETAFKAPYDEKVDTAIVEGVSDDAGQQQAPNCLAWFPASFETDGKRTRQTNPILAFSFGRRLHLVRLVIHKAANSESQGSRGGAESNGSAAQMQDEVQVAELTGKDGLLEPDTIVGLQWFNADLLLLVTKCGLSLFDCRAGRVTERMEGGSAEAILSRTAEQRQYDAVVFQDTPAGVEDEQRRAWTLNHSIRISKGRSFFLTQSDLVVGSLLSWADRLLAYVSQGEFLLAIELATTFYKGKFLGSAVGLPSDKSERTRIIGDKLRELMTASAEYTFSPDRLTDATHVTADGRGVDRTSLFEGLTRVCAKACLALDDMRFLFDQLYDKYEDNGIESIFVGQMEDFIVSGELRTLPIPVVQRLVAFRRDRQEYELAEQIIWHVDPKSLDLDQALSLCIDQKLYDALIYVYNSALEDFVSPIVELLEPLRRVLRSRRRVASLPTNILPHKSMLSSSRSVGSLARFNASYTGSQDGSDEEVDEQDFDDGYKVFSYLSVVLTGHQYPGQDPFESQELASIAKSSIFSFIFSGGSAIWPPGGGGSLVLYGVDDWDTGTNGSADHEPIYPYLRLLLEFDAEAFLDALDLAFEDSYLDDEEIVGKRLSRQLVIGILLELSRPDGSHSSDLRHLLESDMKMSATKESDDVRSPTLSMVARIFICIFVARNAPKYPQFVKLAPHNVDYLLRSLAIPISNDAYPVLPEAVAEMDLIESTKEDRELAVEFLLSQYKPRFDNEWLSVFEQAQFQRILRSAFRQEEKWDRLMGLYLREYVQHPSTDNFASDFGADGLSASSHSQEAFSHIEETLFSALRARKDIGVSLKTALHEQLSGSIIELLDLDPLKTASLLDRFFPENHAEVLNHLAQLDEQRLLLYLRCFFEPVQVSKDWTHSQDSEQASYNAEVGRADLSHLGKAERKMYLDVLCRYDAEAVVRNLDARSAEFFDLENLIDECRKTHSAAVGEARVAGNSDAVIWALDRLGRPKEAFGELDRLVSATAGSIEYMVASSQNAEEQDARVSIEELVLDVRRSVDVAVRLCVERANTFEGHDQSEIDLQEHLQTTPLTVSEKMDTDEVWFRLLRSLVHLVHDVAHMAPSTDEPASRVKGDLTKLVLDSVRDIVQDTLANLVSSTAAEAVSFPALFRRLTGENSEGQDTKNEEQLTAGAAKYYAEVRSVLDGMLSAYHLRSELLGITNKLFERDTFYQFRKLNVQRKRGWRPAGGPDTTCTHCGLLLVGPKRGTRAGVTDGATAAEVDGSGPEPASPAARRGQMSKDVSFSSLDSESLHRQVLLQQRSPSATLLSPTALSHRRRAKSSYDEKAAPLASPRADKGKGVVRSSSSGSNGILDYANHRPGALGADDEIDGYFTTGVSSSDTSFDKTDDDGLHMSASNGSLQINESPARRSIVWDEKAAASEDDGNGSTGTMTPNRNQIRRASSPSSFMPDGWRDSAAQSSALTGDHNAVEAGGRIIIKKSGQMYHESCFQSQQNVK